MQPQRASVRCGHARGCGVCSAGYQVACNQDPEIDWSQNYVPPAVDQSFKEPSPGPWENFLQDLKKGNILVPFLWMTFGIL